MPILFEHQKETLPKMHNGCILCGGVGTGKSMTSLAYFMTRECGAAYTVKDKYYPPVKGKDLYVITTAKKRDSKEWDKELQRWGLSRNVEESINGMTVIVDSWNNIKRYKNVHSAFFIFDEQRVIGRGSWVKTFLNISRKNHWILLSATPGDEWKDYIPVFVANGFYKSRSEFLREHVIYDPFIKKYPKIKAYIHTEILEEHRKEVLILMSCEKPAIAHDRVVMVRYDSDKYNAVFKKYWNIFTNEPIKQASERAYCERRVVNSEQARIDALTELCKKNPRVIVFYTFNYELEILRKVCEMNGFNYTEWNGHKHENILKTDTWVYLAQYSSAAEGWECTDTNVIVFYSQTYSYRMLAQAKGRIDRLNTPFEHLYYYHLRSFAPIDTMIAKALERKEDFNEAAYLDKGVDEFE